MRMAGYERFAHSRRTPGTRCAGQAICGAVAKAGDREGIHCGETGSATLANHGFLRLKWRASNFRFVR